MSRDITIDIAKGIGIICVVYGHSITAHSTAYDFIYSFHMPLFFILFGYFFVDIPFKDFLYKRFRTLFIPFVFFYCLALVLKFIFFYFFRSKEEVIRTLFNGELFRLDMVNIPLWFLGCLMTTAFIYYVLLHFCSKTWSRILFLILLSGIGCIFAFFKIHTPFFFSQACLSVLFLEIGRTLYMYKINLGGVWVLVGTFVVFTVCWIFQSNATNILTLDIDKSIILYWIPAIAGSVFVISLSKNIIRFKCTKVLAAFGEMSLFIFALHLNFGFLDKIWLFITSNLILQGIIKTIVVTIIFYYLGVFLKKYFHFLFSYR